MNNLQWTLSGRVSGGKKNQQYDALEWKQNKTKNNEKHILSHQSRISEYSQY